MAEAHPDCRPRHVCQQPSGKACIEPGCHAPAGTWWGPHWCPEHDKARIDRISASLDRMLVRSAPAALDAEDGDG